MISVGDIVVAVRDGERNKGLPAVVPERGKMYRVESVYPTCYGLGIKLKGLNPAPYRGFFLYVDIGCSMQCFGRPVHDGWYFRKVEKADKEFTDKIKAPVMETV